MTKRVFIIHGWGGYPREGWQGWLADRLQELGFTVSNLKMPNPAWPKMEEWIPYLAEQVGRIDVDTHLVGHSIGCQTIFRFLETQPVAARVRQVILVAPWVHLTEAAMNDGPDAPAIAQPWLETPIDWPKIRPMATDWTAIMASDDPWVPISDAKIFQRELGAEIIRVDGQRHMSGDEGVHELLPALRQFSKQRKE